MALPKIAIPEFTTIRPSTGERITFRPFLVKEEKILLMAAEAKDFASIAYAVKQIVQSCVITSHQDVSTWPFFDLEYLFIQIRAKSIGEKITLKYHHADNVNLKGEACDYVTDVILNLDTVHTPVPDAAQSLVEIDSRLSLKLKYPSLDAIIGLITMSATQSAESDQLHPKQSAAIFDLLADCIESVMDGPDVHVPDNKTDAVQFLESLPVQIIQKIEAFFKTMPKATGQVAYTCAQCGQSDTVQLQGLQDFF